jgi:RHS repeat-associated protein
MTGRCIHGSGTDEPVTWFHGSGYADERVFVQNYEGSVIGYADASGNAAETYKYGPFGEPRNAGNQESWTGSRFRYTGQTTIPEARLYYYKARVYDPVYGRFLQTDPIGSKDDLDLYAYTADDPVNGTDPTGNQAYPTAPISQPYVDGATKKLMKDISEHPGETIQAVGLAIDCIPGAQEIGTPIAGIGGLVKLVDGESGTAVPVTDPLPPKEGMYEFPDKTANDAPYVGQSSNMPSRLADHVATGRLSPGTETTKEVLGGKLAREVAEHNRIQELTGGQKAKNSPAVSNKRDPIGATRRKKLGISDPTD